MRRLVNESFPRGPALSGCAVRLDTIIMLVLFGSFLQFSSNVEMRRVLTCSVISLDLIQSSFGSIFWFLQTSRLKTPRYLQVVTCNSLCVLVKLKVLSKLSLLCPGLNRPPVEASDQSPTLHPSATATGKHH